MATFEFTLRARVMFDFKIARFTNAKGRRDLINTGMNGITVNRDGGLGVARAQGPSVRGGG
jgi:hypothetical protein